MNPKLIVIAGPNGAGKTTITEKLLRHEWIEDSVYINPDIIAQEKFGGWNSPEAIMKAANYAQKMREECLTSMQNMAFETVFSIPEKLEFLRRAKESGFFIRFFFICTNDPSINAQRIALRVMEGGHEVPISKIINRYYRSINNCIKAAAISDRAYFYDNSINDVDPQLLFRTAAGKIVKYYHGELAPWAKDVAARISEQ